MSLRTLLLNVLFQSKFFYLFLRKRVLKLQTNCCSVACPAVHGEDMLPCPRASMNNAVRAVRADSLPIAGFERPA